MVPGCSSSRLVHQPWEGSCMLPFPFPKGVRWAFLTDFLSYSLIQHLESRGGPGSISPHAPTHTIAMEAGPRQWVNEEVAGDFLSSGPMFKMKLGSPPPDQDINPRTNIIPRHLFLSYEEIPVGSNLNSVVYSRDWTKILSKGKEAPLE